MENWPKVITKLIVLDFFQKQLWCSKNIIVLTFPKSITLRIREKYCNFLDPHCSRKIQSSNIPEEITIILIKVLIRCIKIYRDA